MTLFDLANITSTSTIFQIVPIDSPQETISEYVGSIREARANQHLVVARYVNDNVVFIFPSDNENIMLIVVDHKETYLCDYM